ncbi:MAG TPA: hypothetical protein DEA78_00785 [Cyanobacteria bacterium UBA11159]|nr:hypothetical protein [Cyanobacteria bacterium UBA11166]HBR72273.1 hypothetical protein [Cyanobacteria bacterium UBA11159]
MAYSRGCDGTSMPATRSAPASDGTSMSATRSAPASDRGSAPNVNFCIKIPPHVARYNFNGIVLSLARHFLRYRDRELLRNLTELTFPSVRLPIKLKQPSGGTIKFHYIQSVFSDRLFTQYNWRSIANYIMNKIH